MTPTVIGAIVVGAVIVVLEIRKVPGAILAGIVLTVPEVVDLRGVGLDERLVGALDPVVQDVGDARGLYRGQGDEHRRVIEVTGQVSPGPDAFGNPADVGHAAPLGSDVTAT